VSRRPMHSPISWSRKSVRSGALRFMHASRPRSTTYTQPSVPRPPPASSQPSCNAWRTAMAERAPLRAAVIGSGFGGLAVAIRLAAAGVRVTLFEARDQPGGRAYVYRDRGYTFDAGPTVIT